jgi:bacteriocin biosynthesis cyclodehydratase domain-containing protein
MDTRTGLRVHPAAQIVDLGDGRVQVRVPDGDHVTLETRGLALAEHLTALKHGATTAELNLPGVLDEDQTAAWSKVLAALSERGLLVQQGEESPDDSLMSLFDYTVRRNRNFNHKPPVPEALRTVEVCGRGLIADAARACVKGLDLAPREPGHAPGLTFICCDHDDFDFCLAENAAALKTRSRISFLRKSGSRLLIGPIVIPYQTACFNCYCERLESNIEFIDEFEASVRPGENEASERLRDGTGLLSGVVAFLLAHHLVFALDGVMGVVKPGEVHSFDLISAKTARHPILKLPRCRECGRAREGTLVRAVRDLM